MHVTAIVIAGAGARGAYEAGLVSVLVQRLMDEPGWDDESNRIVVVGTSAGAINTAVLSAGRDPLEAAAAALEVWTSVEVSDIFAGLRTTAPRNAAAYLRQVLGGGGRLHSLLDSSPLQQTMEERLDWGDLRKNLDIGAGWVDAAGVVTTACSTGRTVVFLQGQDLELPPADPERGIEYVRADLDVAHVLASAAIPVAFRPVRIERPASAGGWYVDGGVRLNAPIKPALVLGADRVVVVATTPDPDLPRATPVAESEPDVFDAAGVVSNAVLVDRMAEDIRSLRRTNKLIMAGDGTTGTDSPTLESGGTVYRVVPHIYLGPPAPGIIAAAASRVYRERYGSWKRRLSDLGVLGRLLGGTGDTHGEALSFLFFDRDFHVELIELARKHATKVLGRPGTALPWRE